MLTRDLIAPRNADWTIPQNWERFTPAEHAVWDTLFARQSAALEGRAAGFTLGATACRVAPVRANDGTVIGTCCIASVPAGDPVGPLVAAAA